MLRRYVPRNVYSGLDAVDLGNAGGADDGSFVVVSADGISGDLYAKVREQLVHVGSVSTAPYDYIQFNTAYVGSPVEGRLQWNDSVGALEVGLPGGVVAQNIGQEMTTRVRNITGVAITKGSVVTITGSSGNRPTIELADADDVNLNIVCGVTAEDIANGSNGAIVTNGEIRNVDTSAWVEGTRLYLSTIPGLLTDMPPSPPTEIICVGTVTNQHAATGSILLRPTPHKDWVTLDSRYVNASGDTMTGDLLMSGVNRRITFDTGGGLTGIVTLTGTVSYAAPTHFFVSQDFSTHYATFSGPEARFNDLGSDRDFVVETQALDDAFYIDASTNGIGFGTNIPSAFVHIDYSTLVTQNVTAFYVYRKYSPTVDPGTVYPTTASIRSEYQSTVTPTGGISIGLYLNMIFSSSGALSARLHDIVFQNTSTAAIPSVSNIHIRSAQNAGGGSIGSVYGLYVESQTAATNNFSIYTNAGIVRFGGVVNLESGGLSLSFVDTGTTNPYMRWYRGAQVGYIQHHSNNNFYMVNQATTGNIWFQVASGQIQFYTGGSQRMYISSGVVVGAPTGADKGYGTINAGAVYDDGTLLTCYPIEFARTGSVNIEEMDTKYGRGGEHKAARAFAKRASQMVDPEEFAKFWRNNGHLPALPARAAWERGNISIGELMQGALETVEVLAIHIEQLTKRVKELEDGKG